MLINTLQSYLKNMNSNSKMSTMSKLQNSAFCPAVLAVDSWDLLSVCKCHILCHALDPCYATPLWEWWCSCDYCVSLPGSSCGSAMFYCAQRDRLWNSFYFQAWSHQRFCDPPLWQKCRLRARSKKVRGWLCRSSGWPLLFVWRSLVFI